MFPASLAHSQSGATYSGSSSMAFQSSSEPPTLQDSQSAFTPSASAAGHGNPLSQSHVRAGPTASKSHHHHHPHRPHRKAFHAGQFVKVQVSGGKNEVGQIESLDDTKATIATSSGFAVTRNVASLEPAMLVILDLNGVLGYRKNSKTFKKRPHVDELLAFLFRNFVVAVWTSCAEHNGVRIIPDVFGDLECRLLFRLFRDDCTPNPTPDNRYGTVKDLRRVWDRYPFFNAGNTVMIDDSDDKCSHRHCALCPTAYTGDDHTMTTPQGKQAQATPQAQAAAQKAVNEGLLEIITVLELVLEEGSIEPIRRHMVTRWRQEEEDTAMLRADSSVNVSPVPEFSEPTFQRDAGACAAPPPSKARDLPTSSPFFTSSETKAGTPSDHLSLPASTQPTVATGSPGAQAGPAKTKRGVKVKESRRQQAASAQIARQDAYDSEEERDRPSVGNTPQFGFVPLGSQLPAATTASATPPFVNSPDARPLNDGPRPSPLVPAVADCSPTGTTANAAASTVANVRNTMLDIARAARAKRQPPI